MGDGAHRTCCTAAVDVHSTMLSRSQPAPFHGLTISGSSLSLHRRGLRALPQDAVRVCDVSAYSVPRRLPDARKRDAVRAFCLALTLGREWGPSARRRVLSGHAHRFELFQGALHRRASLFPRDVQPLFNYNELVLAAGPAASTSSL